MNRDRRIVVIGATGMLGRDCVEALEEAGVVVPLDRSQLDLTDPARINNLLPELRPHVILNCAGYTDVDGCEEHTDVAREVNARGPAHLAHAARELAAYLIHVSTDYVFDGSKPPPQPYLENDPSGPLSVYGRTKWEGEEAVRGCTPDHLIVRTAWMYGRHGRSFPKAILRKALQGESLRVVDDQFGSPTWSRTLALQIRALMHERITGTVHATSHGHCTWFQFARTFLRMMDLPAAVDPCTTSDYSRPAPRPANSILANRRLISLGLDRMSPWETDLEKFVREHGPALREEVLAH